MHVLSKHKERELRVEFRRQPQLIVRVDDLSGDVHHEKFACVATHDELAKFVIVQFAVVVPVGSVDELPDVFPAH